jgi:hypothetical protein
VWLVPGILLLITSVLALLGGLAGRNRSETSAVPATGSAAGQAAQS